MFVACSIWITGWLAAVFVFCSGCSRGGAASQHRPAELLLLYSWLCVINRFLMVVPWLRQSVAGQSPQRPGFDPISFCVIFVCGGQSGIGTDSSQNIRFSPFNIILRMFRTHYFVCHRRCIIFEIDSVAAFHTG